MKTITNMFMRMRSRALAVPPPVAEREEEDWAESFSLIPDFDLNADFKPADNTQIADEAPPQKKAG